MKQHRDKLQLRTPRQQYTPPIEQSDYDWLGDTFNIILAVLVLVGILGLAIYDLFKECV
jgi:hypothetical protein